MMNRWAIAAAATGATVVGTLAAPAQAITLGEIWAGDGTFMSEHFTYSNFTCSLGTSSLDTQLLVPNSCDEIKINDNSTAFDLEIQGPFSATNLGSSGVAFLDALIGFDVMAKNGNPITNIELAFNGAFEGLARASVTETAFDMNGDIIGQLKVTNSGAGTDLEDPALEAGDFDLLYPVGKVRIVKDILLQAGPGSSAEISLIGQNYIKDVPEPGTMGGLLVLGSLGLGFMFKRNRQFSGFTSFFPSDNDNN
ncbi:MAG: PEP-CTERM sorting domain-containing protein [Coleofasciculus chthonoplastes F3-SA18-01]|uniref:PEP-CTERM sorting domain-containing protein n=1 Tax=Coleofasciculus chthonoplastes TaxID=64178 RepID=UPI0032F3D66F